MEPIINPWIFYLADVCNSIFIVSSIICICTTGMLLIKLMEINDRESKGYYDKNRWYGDECRGKSIYTHDIKQRNTYAIIAFITVLIAIITPQSDTVYKMIAAYYATPDNINAAQDNVIEFIGKLADAIATKIK